MTQYSGRLFTTRVSANESPSNVSIPLACSRLLLHVEDGAEVITITGTAKGSIPAYITKDGRDIQLPFNPFPNNVFAVLATITGTQMISILAWK